MGPNLDSLLSCFPDEHPLDVEYVSSLPEPYSSLLAHNHHMTVTLEHHYKCPVEVNVLKSGTEGDVYHRRIELLLRGSKTVVLYGLVRIHLPLVPHEARREILEETKPLGLVLIEWNVLRRVEHTALLHFSARPVDVERFALAGPQILCGRLAYLHCNDHPAIELLEVVRP